jgi:hypothetical protein
MKEQTEGGVLEQVRIGQVWKTIKISIIGPHSFLCPFFKIQGKNSRKGGTP